MAPTARATRSGVGTLIRKSRPTGHPERLGKGRGVREAVGMATGEIIGYADADYKVPIEEFDKIEPLFEEFDVVTGSRALNRALIERNSLSTGGSALAVFRLHADRSWAARRHRFTMRLQVLPPPCGAAVVPMPEDRWLYVRCGNPGAGAIVRVSR